MGSAMAGNLNRHLLKESQSPLHFYNRTASRGAFLAELGAHQEDSISTLVKRCDLIFLSVSDDAALLSTVDQVLGVDQLIGKVVIDTTTVHPNTTKKVAVSLGERGASFLAGKPNFCNEAGNCDVNSKANANGAQQHQCSELHQWPRLANC